MNLPASEKSGHAEAMTGAAINPNVSTLAAIARPVPGTMCGTAMIGGPANGNSSARPRLSADYTACSALWIAAARAYADRAAKADVSCYDKRDRATWNNLAVQATHRAARYARLAALSNE